MRETQGTGVRLTVKMVLAAVSWTVAVAAAVGRTWGREEDLGMWAILAAALAAVSTSAIIMDFVADHSVRRATEEMDRQCARAVDEVVDRLTSRHEETVQRVAEEIVKAMREDSGAPTRIR